MKTGRGEKRLRKMKNFTLIELLIVIAILAILASLLLPSLNSAKGKAYSIQCMGNLRQQGTALACYWQDNNDTFMYYLIPPAVWPDSDGYVLYNGNGLEEVKARAKSWYNATLAAYIASAKVRRTCPAAALNPTYGNYSMNLFLNQPLSNYGAEFKLNKVLQPSCTFYAMDGRNARIDVSYNFSTVAAWMESAPPISSWLRHSNKVNVVHVDGHCGTMDENALDANCNKTFYKPQVK